MRAFLRNVLAQINQAGLQGGFSLYPVCEVFHVSTAQIKCDHYGLLSLNAMFELFPSLILGSGYFRVAKRSKYTRDVYKKT
jgi:hypothetical protein